MTPHVQAVIRAAIAVQIAALEWQDADVNDAEAHRALETCARGLDRAVKKLIKEG